MSGKRNGEPYRFPVLLRRLASAVSLSDFLHLQRCRVLPRLRGNQRNLEHLLQRLDGMEVEYVADLLWNILDVCLVVLRQNNGLDSGAMSAEHLFLQSTDRQHSPAQRD